MNVGRALEVLAIVATVSAYAYLSSIVAARWHSRQYVQTLNRAAAFYVLTERYNSTELAEFLLAAGSNDVVRIMEYSGEFGKSVKPKTIYDSGWEYGFYSIRALADFSEKGYVVVEVHARG